MLRFSIVACFLFACLVVFAVFDYLHFYFFILLAGILLLIGIYDVVQTKRAILRNFPTVGHLRYIMEFIRPEMQQYFISDDLTERPLNRETRSLVYRRAKGVRDTIPLGTQFDIDRPGYEMIRHSMAPTIVAPEEARITIGNEQCSKPYSASRLNVSAMSFGALSNNAILALNKGAKIGNFAHNTGEGGLSEHHLAGGGDLVWQLGTANFGARDRAGRLDPVLFKERSAEPAVKMIEIKISQGAKPSHGGILPAAKITPEIARIRGIELGKDCDSPPCNPEFSTPIQLLEFLARLRELSGGKPVGFKLCLGIRKEFLGICKAIVQTQIFPDFITVDGAEGGTGAAPVEFVNSVGTPINDAVLYVDNALRGTSIRDKIRIIASGKIATGMDMVTKIGLGADLCNSARAMMLALGCIQSLQCNANTCPTGVTTQNVRLARGLVVEDKCVRVANYHHSMIHSFLELVGAMGIHHVDDLSPKHIFHRIDYAHSRSYADLYGVCPEGRLLAAQPPEFFKKDWEEARAEAF